MFNPKVRSKIFLSALGEIVVLGIILKLSIDHGFLTVGFWYWGPYMWTNFWLVLYTWLQHTDPSVHHLFHEMPFYKADVATKAVKEYLEPMGVYNYDPTPWYWAAWRIAKTCHYVESTEGIQYYKSLEDIPIGKDVKKD